MIRNAHTMALFLEAGSASSAWTGWEKGLALSLFVVALGSSIIILLSRKREDNEKQTDKALATQTNLATSWEKQAALYKQQRDEALLDGERLRRELSGTKEDLESTLMEYKELIQVDMQQFIQNHRELGQLCAEVLPSLREERRRLTIQRPQNGKEV